MDEEEKYESKKTKGPRFPKSKEPESPKKYLVRLRQAERGKGRLHKNEPLSVSGYLHVKEFEGTGEGTGGWKARNVTLVQKSGFCNPMTTLAHNIADALDPVKVPSKGRTLSDMSEGEKEELKKKYGVDISTR